MIQMRPMMFWLMALVWVAGTLPVQGQAVTLHGDQVVWHKITLDLEGPATAEDATPNPFVDLRMDVVFEHAASGTRLVIPGFFAADGQPADTSATQGNRWHCRFRAAHPGTWTYRVSFRQGEGVALAEVSIGSEEALHALGEPLAPFDGVSGTFEVSDDNPALFPDLRADGRLQYVGGHHLQFAGSGRYFLKFGPDSPENFLAFDGFDNTPEEGNKGIRHPFTAHAQHFEGDERTWGADDAQRGQNILGAVNYIASTGANSVSLLLNNIGRLVPDPDNDIRPFSGPGDDDRVFPYTDKSERMRFDCSKLDQWEIVFDHAQARGLHLHFKLAEIENARDLDGGQLGDERRLYYREMLARFGHHLALNWNISEEIPVGPNERRDWLEYFERNDPWQNHRVFHTGPRPDKTVFYGPHLGETSLTGVSLQTPEATGTDNVFNETLRWRNESAAAGHPWVAACDEQGPGHLGVNASFDLSRRDVLWGNLMAGGAGVEYYSGGSDLALDDYAHFAQLLAWSNIAVNEFFYGHDLPFWQMANRDDLVQGEGVPAHCLTDGTDVYVIYLRDGGTATLDLSGVEGAFEVSWFDPREGGAMQASAVTEVNGGGVVALGDAPNDAEEDWVVLVKR